MSKSCANCAKANVCVYTVEGGDDYSVAKRCAEFSDTIKIAYLCTEHGEGLTCPHDGRSCSYNICKHTTDVKYAKNFVQVSDDNYMEVDDDQRRWIPITDEKPEPYVDVIFCDVDGEIFKGSMFDNGDWYDDAYDDPVKNVVAWMPLPESYKGDDKNKTIKPA